MFKVNLKSLVISFLILVSLSAYSTSADILEQANKNFNVNLGKQPHHLGAYLNNSFPFNESLHQAFKSYGNAFLKGLEANTFSPDFQNCYNNLLQFGFLELPMMSIRIHYGNTNDNIFNTTKMIKATTKHVDVCVNMIEDLQAFVESQMVEFASVSNYFMSLFQNIMANIVEVMYIYKDIVKDQGKGTQNMTDIFYNAGKLVNIVLLIHNLDQAASPNLQHIADIQLHREQIKLGRRANFIPYNPMSKEFQEKIKGLRTFDGIVNLTMGIVNGTFPVDAEKFDECRNTIDTEIRAASGPLMRAIDQKQWYMMLHEILFLVGQVDEISEECYYALEDTGVKYYKWFKYEYFDGEIFFNAALSIGTIMQDVLGIVLYFSDLPWAGPKNAVEVGKLIGDIIASFMNVPKWKPWLKPMRTTD